MIGIGDLDAKSRNKRKCITRIGQCMFNGKKYAYEASSGYYVCTTGDRKRLHDIIWITENECGLDNIPEGCVIHHIDWDKTHNEISNLTCVSVQGHNIIHNPPKNGSKYKVKIVAGGISEVIDTTCLTEGK